MELVAVILIVGGLFFFTGGSVGILRFPDFYSRLHPAGKLDTAGQLLTLSAAAIFALEDFAREDLLTAAKIMLIVIFVYLTSPTATHAIVDAGVRAGLKPWMKASAEASTATEEAR
jgi:multicomponent Na+:H+ antiporter subunit G